MDVHPERSSDPFTFLHTMLCSKSDVQSETFLNYVRKKKKKKSQVQSNEALDASRG